MSTEDRAACFANRAAAKLKLEDYEGCLFAYDRLKISTEAFIGALEDCSEALSLDENYWKAKYRRKEVSCIRSQNILSSDFVEVLFEVGSL